MNNDASKEIPPPFADKTKERLAMGPTEQDADQCGNTFLHVTVLDDLLNSSTVMYIIERTLQLYETVQKINNQCAIRSLNLLDFPLLSGFKEHASLIRCSDYDNINNLDVDKFASVEEGKNKETLKRNLNSFNLDVDTVIGDGIIAVFTVLRSSCTSYFHSQQKSSAILMTPRIYICGYCDRRW